MDSKIASFLLKSLLERIDRNQIGVVSQHERHALVAALKALQTMPDADPSATFVDIPPPSAAIPPPLPDVTLVLDAIQTKEPVQPGLLMCLDFGTAMSKAFAAEGDAYVDLALGQASGHSGYVLPSSVFIGEDGTAYFGQEAIDRSDILLNAGRARLDSIKSWLSLRSEGDLDSEVCVLKQDVNPTQIRLTEGDLIRLYLAYLTDMSCVALASARGIGRYVKRRYARPCWITERQTRWADRLMRTLLAEAQILADTFTGQWAGGISVDLLKAAIEQVKQLPEKPEYLIDASVPEPVAVAAGAIGDTENMRDAYMVVDAGAGTTDFGLFVFTPGQNFNEPKLFQIPGSIHGFSQAGNRIDHLLRAYILQKEGVDTKDVTGSLIDSDMRLKIRVIKENLFRTKEVRYALRDGTTGTVRLDEFLSNNIVKKFSVVLENEFKKALSAVDESWLRWLSMPGVKLNVILTGGSSSLPMMRSLASGTIDVNGFRIERVKSEPRPDWIRDAPQELEVVYPQLAVAIGGASREIPASFIGPASFAGGTRTTYASASISVPSH